MTASSKPRASYSTLTAGNKQAVRQIIANLISTNFSGTLGTERDITNIVMGLVQQESSFRPDAAGISLSISNSSIARDYWTSSAITSLRASASGAQQFNISEGLRAWGVMQVGGWNVVRGASKAGATELEKSRPDLANQLMVNPGDSISAKYSGQSNLQTQILAGLVMLESKWKAVRGSGSNWSIGSRKFSSRIAATVAAYLGLGARDVVTGITPEEYANRIVYGSAYQVANSGVSPANSQVAPNPTVQVASNGPTQTAASGHNQQPASC